MQETLFHCQSDNCCGYCNLHQCAITVKQLKKKQCLLKQCYHLTRIEEHPYWRQRAIVAQKRKERKARLYAV